MDHPEVDRENRRWVRDRQPVFVAAVVDGTPKDALAAQLVANGSIMD